MTDPMPSTYMMTCEHAEPDPYWPTQRAGKRCKVAFEWVGLAVGYPSARNQAMRAARDAGWTITQDHDGTVHVICPGEGERLPADITRGRFAGPVTGGDHR